MSSITMTLVKWGHMHQNIICKSWACQLCHNNNFDGTSVVDDPPMMMMAVDSGATRGEWNGWFWRRTPSKQPAPPGGKSRPEPGATSRQSDPRHQPGKHSHSQYLSGATPEECHWQQWRVLPEEGDVSDGWWLSISEVLSKLQWLLSPFASFPPSSSLLDSLALH